MNSQEKIVTTVDELVGATKDTAVHHIVARRPDKCAVDRLAPG